MITYTLAQLAAELVGALFTFFCACTMLVEKQIFPKRGLLLALVLFADTALLVNDAVALGFRGQEDLLAYWLVRLSNFMVFALTPVIIMLVYYFIVDIIASENDHVDSIWSKFLHFCCSIHLLIVLISQFTDFIYYFDATNTYHRSPAYPLMTVLALIELLNLAGVVLVHRKQISKTIRRVLLLYILMPVFSAIFQTFYYGISLNNIAATIALLLLFLTYEVSKSGHYYSQKERLLEHEMELKNKELVFLNQERELTEARLQISLSQMQPHFMFNTLGSIEQLCRTDATKAADATHYFAQYLRNNLLAINASSLKPFSDELRHIRAYIWLEKMRFGDDLEFIEDIDVSDFMMPILSIQPLVENSVNKGMRVQEEGVISIKLRAYEDDDAYHIVITENIEEYVPDFFEEEHFESSVLNNIIEHLRLMCDGTVTLTRQLGKGTTYQILIPKDYGG